VTPVNEITPEEIALHLPVDTTPPVTTAEATPPRNAAGWNRTDVVVTFTATDDISGVARTEYDLDGAGPKAATGPITISAEGIHTLLYHSIDRSQNVEAAKELIVRIDKTPPEEVITYDPNAHRIVVTGRDALSGVDPGALSPVAIMPTTWTDFGSDAAEMRSYPVLDHAGNSLVLTMKVKCEPDEYEFSVTDLRYNDERRHDRPQRNTIEFERLIGRGLDRPLLAVRQEVSFGEGDGRTTVEASYDVLHDETEIERYVGGCGCTPTDDYRRDKQAGDRRDDENAGEHREDRSAHDNHPDDERLGSPDGCSKLISELQPEVNDPEQRGLILLRIVTHEGQLRLEE
jgi:hypothetical protein